MMKSKVFDEEDDDEHNIRYVKTHNNFVDLTLATKLTFSTLSLHSLPQ